MERPPLIPPTPKEEKAALDKELNTKIEWLRKKTAEAEAHKKAQAGTEVSPTIRPIDFKQMASGERPEDDDELVLNSEGKWVMKKYLE